jgi:hypothetical protein
MSEQTHAEDSRDSVIATECSASKAQLASLSQRMPGPLYDPATAFPSGLSQSAIAPSGCGCGAATTFTPVFAVGRLSYDFDSITVRESMQRRMKEDGGLVQDPRAFMRHLFRVNDDGSGVSELNLHEASRVDWVLEYGRKPLYVVRPPQGATVGEDLKSIALDYLEQQGLVDSNKSLRLGKKDTLVDATECPDYFAIAGYTNGESVTLLETGHTVPVLVAEYDLTDSWNLDAFLADACNKGFCDANDGGQVAQFRRILDLLHKFIEPLGDTPEKRAKNFVVSHAVLIAANSVAATSQQTLVLRAMDLVGKIGGRYPQQEVILVKAIFMDMKNPKEVEYSIDYYVNVSQPKPYFESISPLGFA